MVLKNASILTKTILYNFTFEVFTSEIDHKLILIHVSFAYKSKHKKQSYSLVYD